MYLCWLLAFRSRPEVLLAGTRSPYPLADLECASGSGLWIPSGGFGTHYEGNNFLLRKKHAISHLFVCLFVVVVVVFFVIHFLFSFKASATAF